MDSLKGKIVNVVLIVQEAKGMEQLKPKVFISANLNDRILESDPVQTEDCPQFNTNLIWEMEKKDLRKIRSSNQPLRIECLNLDSQGKKEKFGHILLDLRSAQIIINTNQIIYYKWYKLIGVRNKKRNATPELYLSLTIRNHEDVGEEGIVARPVIEAGDIKSEIVSHEVSEPLKVSPISVKYLENGYIKIGEPKINEDFALNIMVKTSSNLDLLLPEELVFRQTKSKYCMAIKIFGVPIKMKPFNTELHETLHFNEKIVIRLESQIEILAMFFAEENFEVNFYYGNQILGSTIIPLDNLVETRNLVLDDCKFQSLQLNGVVPIAQDGRQPTVSLELILVQMKKLGDIVGDMSREFKNIVNNNTEDASKASGDGLRHDLQYNAEAAQISDQDNENMLEELQNEERENNIVNDVRIPQTNVLHSLKELEEWKESQKRQIEEALRNYRDEELSKVKQELDQKRWELDENIKQSIELNKELEEKLEIINTNKGLRSRRDSTNILELNEINQEKFAECDKELLIEYISTLQNDILELKKMINERDEHIANIQRTALTKEQTTNLLQELRGLEEKFEFAQQTKLYFKEQWKKACEEIHGMKNEEFRQIQDQINERREELSELNINQFVDRQNHFLSF